MTIRVVVAVRLLAGMAVAASMSLSGCSQKSDDDPLVLNATADAGRVEDTFGDGFGEAFRADPNSEPKNVADSDVRPVSLTTEPVPIN